MPVRLYTIRFDMLDARSKQRIAAMPLPPERVSGLDQELTHSVFTRLAVAAEGEPSGGAAFRGASRHQSVCLLTALLIEIDRLTAKRPGEPPVLVDDRLGRIQELALRISRTLAWRMSVADMAREAGLSPSHFAVSFRKATTKSPRQFIVNWRIRHAAQMLAETELPIKAIAAQVGCEDVGFFSRQFRARAGFAPRAFRNRSSARRQ